MGLIYGWLLLGVLQVSGSTPVRGRDLNPPEVTPRLDELRQYRRTGDPDSTYAAATRLAAVAPVGSVAAITAQYYQAESQLHNYDRRVAATAVGRFQQMGTTLEGPAHDLHELYNFALQGGHQYGFVCNYERAAIYYLNALRIAERDADLQPRLLVSLASVMSTLGQYPLVQRYLDRYKAAVDPASLDALGRIQYQTDLAWFYYCLEQEERAMSYQQEALRLLADYPDPLPYLTSAAYRLASDIQYGIKKNKRCRQDAERADAIRPSYSTASNLIPITYHLGDYTTALTECRRALEYLIPGFQPADDMENPEMDHPALIDLSVAHILRWKARTLYKLALEEKDAAALPLLRASISTAEQARLRWGPYLMAAEGYTMTQHILNRANTYVQGYQLRAAYELYRRTQAPEDLKRFFYYIEMRKNYLISAAFSVDHLPTAARNERQARMTAMEDLEYRIVDPENDSTAVYERRILRYSQELDSTLARINRQYPRPITDQAQLTYADPDSIQASLDKRTVYVEYAQQWQHWYAYVITAERQYAIKLAADFRVGDAISLLINALKDPLQVQRSKRETLIELNHYVYQQLLRPMEVDLTGKDRLIIVPERDLCLLPFEVLLDKKDKLPYADLDYLINRFEISYHSSGTLYEQLRKRPSVEQQSFLGFAPVFTRTNTQARQRAAVDFFPEERHAGIEDGHFVGLPGTEIELRQIDALLPDSALKTLVLHREATVARLSEELRRPYRYVHIATHGFMNFYDPRLSAFATYGPGGRGGDYFFAHETNLYDLHPDLVVLSSCESGVGRIIEGENVVGLGRAFMAAGAKNILYSLWKINDRYSSDLMTDFYAAHLKGVSYAAALRAAKLRLLANPTTAAPRYWAPFVLTGE